MSKKEIINVTLNPEIVREKIYIVRGRKVMLDKDLAMLYGVPTRTLNQAVKRNAFRFPEDFMFKLEEKETGLFLRSQFVILKKGRGTHAKYTPFVFTEQGIAMLSSVLNSPKAISVNIQIIRIFTKIREMVDAYKELREKVEEMEKKNETSFQEIYRVIKHLIREKEKPKDKIGFAIEPVN